MDKLSLINSFFGQFLLTTIFLPASMALAGPESYDYKTAPPPPPQPWWESPPPVEFRIGIPGWIAGLSGDFGVRGVVTAVINKRAGGTGLISGRKAFQRPVKEGIELLNAIQDVYLAREVTIA